MDNFDRAIALSPSRSGYYFNRGYIYETLKRQTDALCDYTQTLLLDPQEVRAYVRRAGIYRSLGRAEEAILEYQRAHKRGPFFLNYKRGIAARVFNDGPAGCRRIPGVMRKELRWRRNSS